MPKNDSWRVWWVDNLIKQRANKGSLALKALESVSLVLQPKMLHGLYYHRLLVRVAGHVSIFVISYLERNCRTLQAKLYLGAPWSGCSKLYALSRSVSVERRQSFH